MEAVSNVRECLTDDEFFEATVVNGEAAILRRPSGEFTYYPAGFLQAMKLPPEWDAVVENVAAAWWEDAQIRRMMAL